MQREYPDIQATIIVPIRNEADFIERCLHSILQNDYPENCLEMLVVDGMSDDGTREIVKRFISQNSHVRLLDNPFRIVPHAMNIGIREAKGDIIIRVDGHATVNPDFVRMNVRALQAHPEAWCVGGAVETISTSWVGQSIAAAMSSPVGVGNAMFRLGHYEGYVDTIAFGAYWRWVFDKIGLFDEELIRNQDDELNLRLILAGGKIYMTPSIGSQYYARSSLKKLAVQYGQYGFWRIRTIQKHRRPATIRQIIPLCFVCAWIILIMAALFSKIGLMFLAAFATAYVFGLMLGTLGVVLKTNCKNALLAPIIFGILHFSYGLGSLKGVVWWVLLRKGAPGNTAAYRTSR